MEPPSLVVGGPSASSANHRGVIDFRVFTCRSARTSELAARLPRTGKALGGGLIQVTARIEAHSAQRRELAQALLHWSAVTKQEPGAISADLYEDVGTANIFCVVMRWATRPAFEAHLQSGTFRSLLGAVEVLAGPCEVSLTEGAGGGGTVTTLRCLRDAVRAGSNGDSTV